MASRQYQSLNDKYDRNYITEEALRGWVEINKRRNTMGITAEEFEEITGLAYKTI